MVDAKLAADVLARLARCLRYWEQQGYQFVPLPWLAPARYTDATRPLDVPSPDIPTPHGNLVASGEQSFLMLMDTGQLPPGAHFIGWTPCFRQEPTFDARHHFYFLKAELLVRAASPEQARAQLPQLVAGAHRWMQQEMRRAGVLELLTLETVSPDQTDIVLGQLELGSYGVRTFGGQAYLYGTACAEPRFSQALEAARR